MTESEIQEHYSFRPYRKEDYTGVVQLWEMTGMGSPERGDNDTTIEETIRIGGNLLVMEEKDSGSICGTSWMTYDGRRMHLHHFGIRPQCQGKGLSKFLLKESLKRAKNKGMQVKLEVHTTNERAINLYEKYGFKHLGNYNVYIIRDITKNTLGDF
jgi:ribosomal protein S18 acetylase RimI-like enzyme